MENEKIKTGNVRKSVLLILLLAMIVLILGFVYYSLDIKEKRVMAAVQSINLAREIDVQKSIEDLQSKDLNSEGLEINEDDQSQVNLDDLPTLEDDVKDQENKKQETSSPYYIKVNYRAQTVTIYKKDSNGNYTIPVKAMVCSTGTDTPTSGVYKTPSKYRWIKLKGDVWGQYSTRIVGSILFHSVYYYEKNNYTLAYKQYDRLGNKASAGCIRITTGDALWIYNNCPIGTQVEFYSSSNPGPLGKPAAKKIGSAPAGIRTWDPTDPDPKNPWKTYKPENEEKIPVAEKPKEEPKTPIVEEKDTVKPTIKGVENMKEYNNGTTLKIEVLDNKDSVDQLEIVLKKNGQKIEFKSGNSLSQAGKYELTVKDKSGNTNIITFTIKEKETKPENNINNTVVNQVNQENKNTVNTL